MYEQLLIRLRERAADLARRTDLENFAPAEVGAPVSAAALAEAERLLRFQLPPLLRSIYREVGDSGFGPAYGLFPLMDERPEHASGLVQQYKRLGREQEKENRGWPFRLVPVCCWGDLYACVDCSQAQGPVLLYVGRQDAFAPLADSLESWLTAWLDGVDVLRERYPELVD